MSKIDDSELFFAQAISMDLRLLNLTFTESIFANLMEDIELGRDL
jgi:hypothetical protein